MTDYEIVSWGGGNILTCFSFKVQDEQYPGIDNETDKINPTDPTFFLVGQLSPDSATN